MRKFRFPLEGVSRVRELKVQSCQADLAKTLQELEAAEKERQKTEQELRRSIQGAPKGLVVQVQHLLEQDARLRQLQAEARRQEEGLAEGRTQADLDRGRLADARKGVKAVEKIRERRYVEFVRAVVREEQKFTDEVAARTHRTREAA
jgi:flagellar protein FliJ